MVHNASILNDKLLSRDKQLASFGNCLMLVLAEASKKANEVVRLDCLVPECITNTDYYHLEDVSHKCHPECTTLFCQVTFVII